MQHLGKLLCVVHTHCGRGRKKEGGVITRPAQKMPLSAKYWVAKSPIANLDKTMLAPEFAQLANFS